MLGLSLRRLSLRRLSRDWQLVHGHPLLLAETFVDPSRFAGTCYRAANWHCLGETLGYARHAGQYRHHGQPKTIWIYALHTQQETARFLVEDKQAHYLFTVKDNQKTLRSDLQAFDWEAFPLGTAPSIKATAGSRNERSAPPPR